MAVLQKQLTEQIGKDILVIQIDGKAFKGRLVEFDNDTLVLTNLLELKSGKWLTPSLVLPDSAQKTVELKDVVVQLSAVSRIYPLMPKRLLEKPAAPPPPSPAKKFGEPDKVVIRSSS